MKKCADGSKQIEQVDGRGERRNGGNRLLFFYPWHEIFGSSFMLETFLLK